MDNDDTKQKRRNYYLQNREHILARHKAIRLALKGKIKAEDIPPPRRRGRKPVLPDSDESKAVQERTISYYQKNREKILQNRKQNYLAKKSGVLQPRGRGRPPAEEIKTAYYAQNRERILERMALQRCNTSAHGEAKGSS
jgi:hypothetical protein